MRRGKEVFIFLSHQWLAFDQPDPDNVHFTAMKQAVTAVAADAGVPIEQTRVWVDYCSIPQENQSEQRLAIASLPTTTMIECPKGQRIYKNTINRGINWNCAFIFKDV